MAARRLLIVRSQLRLSGTTERLRMSVRALIGAGWEVHVLASPGVRSREIEEAGAVLHADHVARRGWSAPFVRGRARRLFDRLEATLALVIGQELAPLAAALRRPHVLELDRPPQAKLPSSRAHLRGVIAPCATLIEAIVNRGGLPRELLSVLAHAPQGDPQMRAPFTPDGPPRVGVAGGLEGGLGTEALFEAGRSLIDAGQELQLVVLGEGPAERSLRRRARDLGIAGQVTITAPAAPSTRELLSQLDVYVCPQPEGTPGWLTAEALSLGRPALLAANQGSFQWVEDGVDGYLVDRADPSALAKGLGRLLSDPAAAREVGDRARTRWGTPQPYGDELAELVERAVSPE